MEDRIKSAIHLVETAGYTDISTRLKQALNVLETDVYAVAVVGEFKAGKSTLINRIFLREDLLFTDILEATAVPTELRYGTRPVLEVVPFSETVSRTRTPFSEGETEVRLPAGEGTPDRIENPSPEDIRSRTSAESPEGRTRLAETTARVRLWWPAPHLDGLALFDTPGINSINPAVIATTYRIIPEADLVLFVTPAKQLSSIETSFLSSRVFSAGISRMMVIVTCDAEAAAMSETERVRLAESIRNQLASIGREHIPVEMVDLRNRSAGTAPETSFRQRIETPYRPPASGGVDSVIDDLLGPSGPAASPSPASAEKAPAETPASLGVDVLEQKLVRFIRDNVRAGRMEKLSHLFSTQVRLALARCESELSVMNRSDSERRKILADIRTREAELRLEHERLTGEFRKELETIQDQVVRELDAGLETVFRNYLDGFDACETLGEVQERLQMAEQLLKGELESLFLRVSQEATVAIRELIRKYDIKSQSLLHPWQSEMSRKLQFDAGILSRIPSFAVLALDILLFARFGPFGPLADILIRLVAGYIPLVNRLLPVSIAGSVLKTQVRSALNEQLKMIRNDLPEQIAERFGSIADRIIQEWNAWADEQTAAVRRSVEAVVNQPEDMDRQTVLADVKAKLQTLSHSDRP